MVASVAFLLFAPPIVLTPTDDIWVYPHASDPQADVYLRVWGVGGLPVAAKDADVSDFSYSYLQFDVAGVPTKSNFSSVKLILTHIANAGFSPESAKKAPLQVRALKSGFTEKSWNFDQVGKYLPGEILGSAVPKAASDGKEFTVTVDLTKTFKKYLSANSKSVALALTSALNPADDGRASIYKFWSKDNPKPEWRPRLEIETGD